MASAMPVYADQFVRHSGFGPNGVANALRLPAKIGVECAQDDTCMTGSPVLMKAKKVAAIVRQQNPAVSDGERRNFGVRHGGIRHSRIR
jgi:hypothetical protein